MYKASMALLCLILSVLISNLISDNPERLDGQSEIQVISNPIHIDKEGLDFHGTTNLLLCPENRTNSESRTIAVQYYKFPAKKAATMPPVFYLPGGPGGRYSEKFFYEKFGKEKATAWTFELEILNQNRDLIILNQRGQSFAPGFAVPNFEYSYHRGYKDEVMDLNKKAQSQADAFEECIDKFTADGVDVRGYDIMNLVDDIEDIRKYYSYEKVALVGTSFGSQWALSYLHAYPERTDRLLLSGVEPIDHGWDDPAGIWNVLAKIESEAKLDENMKSDLPKVGLLEAEKEIVSRLEEKDLDYHLVIPEKNIDEWIKIGADDFRHDYMCAYAEDRTESLELWPKYISEIYNQDYRLLAYRIRSGREGKSWSLMMNHLIDNSLGISKEREKLLSTREEQKWIGDPSVNYRQTRKVNPTPTVAEDFRVPVKIEIPILMIQGNMDWNTPIENALYVLENYTSAHLVTVNRGTHSAKRELILADKELGGNLIAFINMDFNKKSFEEYKKSLPTTFDLPKIKFDPIGGSTILDEVLGINQ